MNGLSTNCLKIGMLMNYIPVRATEQGTLITLGSEFRQVHPLLFQDKEGHYTAFREDENKQVQYLFIGTGAFQKLNWNETPNALLIFTAFFVLIFMPMGVLWPTGCLIWRKKFLASWLRVFPPGRFLAGLVSFLILFFLASFVVLFLQMDHYWQIMRNEFPWTWLTKLLLLTPIISLLSLGLPIFAVLAWIKKRGTFSGRIFFTLVTVSALLFIWVLQTWNLLVAKY